MTNFYKSSLNYFRKHLQNTKGTCSLFMKFNNTDFQFRGQQENSALISYMKDTTDLLESAQIFDLNEIKDISGNISDVKYQGNLLSNMEEIRLPFPVCYFEMEGASQWIDSDPMGFDSTKRRFMKTSGVLAWETSYKEFLERLQVWTVYDPKERVNDRMLGHQKTFIGPDRVIFLLSITGNTVNGDATYIMGGQGGLLLNASRPTLTPTIPFFNKEIQEGLNIKRPIKNFIDMTLASLRPHEFDEGTINKEIDQEMDITYNSMYIDTGYMSAMFRHVYRDADQISKELAAYRREGSTEEGLDLLANNSCYSYAMLLASESFAYMTEQGFDSDRLREEFLRTNPTITDGELDYIVNLAESNMDSPFQEKGLKAVNYGMVKVIDNYCMSKFIHNDLKTWKIFIQYISYMIQNQKIEVKSMFSSTHLKKYNIKKESAKGRSRVLYIKDTKTRIDSEYISKGLGVPKCRHLRRATTRNLKNGRKVQVRACEVNGHLGTTKDKSVYKFSLG